MFSLFYHRQYLNIIDLLFLCYLSSSIRYQRCDCGCKMQMKILKEMMKASMRYEKEEEEEERFQNQFRFK